jgi:putative PEP-CTERM system TPR-repeat lipoprotein
MSRFRKVSSVSAVCLALALGTGLSGCDRFRNFTDQEHVQRAKDFQAKGDVRASEIELKNALSKNPDNAEARLLLGDLYLTLQRGASAEKEFKRALKLGAGREALKVPLARAYNLQNQYQQMLDEIDVGPDTSERNASRILKLRGDAMMGLRRLQESCDLYQKANARDSRNVEAYSGLAVCAVAKQDMDLARRYLDDALKIDPKDDGTWAYIGQLEHARNNAKGAEEGYAQAIKLNPRNVEALAGHASLMIRADKLERAGEDAKKLRQSGAEHPAVLYIDALLSLAKKESQRGLESVQKLEKAYPAYFPGWLLAAQLHFSTGSLTLAEQYVDRYLAVQPQDGAASRLKAAILLRSQRAAQVPALLAPLLERNPNDQGLLVVLGQAYLDMGDYAKASQLLEKALSIDPTNVAVQTRLGGSYLGAGMSTEAETVLAAASRADPQNTEADLLLVVNHVRNKQYDKAFAAIAALEKKQPKSPVAHRLRANIYMQRNELAQARSSLEQAAALQPGDLSTASALAQLDLRENKPDAAKRRFVEVLDKDPKSIGAMLALAQIAASRNLDNEYVEWLQKASNIERTALQPRALLSQYYLAKQNPQQALTIAREAQTANPDSLAALELLGKVQMAAGQKENAAASFAQLLAKAPTIVAAYLELAGVQMELRRFGDARSTLSKGLTRLPGNVALLDALGRLELAEGKLDEALKHAQQITALQPKAIAGHVLEGDVLLQRNRVAEAARAFEQAWAKAKSGPVMARLHQTLSLDHREAEADKRMLQWLQEQPKDIGSRIFLAESFLMRKQAKPAIEQYEAVLKLVPNHPRVLNNLAMLYQEAGDARALDTAQRAYRMSPDDPRVMDTYGWVLVQRGDPQRGADLLKQAMAKAPGATSLRYRYAAALAKAGDRAGARRELDGLLKSSKAFPEKDQATELLKTL